MSRLVVIAEEETALGFELAGVDVIAAVDVDSAREQLQRVLGEADVALVAVSASLLERLDEPARRRIESSDRPVVVSLPAGGPTAGLPTRREYLAGLIRRAIGFQITFPGEAERTT